MKYAILCFPSINNEKPQYPIGLYKIAYYCRNEYNVIVIDQRIGDNIYQEIDSCLETEEVVCIGISVMTGSQIKNAIEISEKYFGKVPIVWGGIHPSITPEQTIKNIFIDYVVIGEGEKSFLNLLQHLDGKEIEQELFLSKTNKNFKINILDGFAEVEQIDFNKYRIDDAYLISRDGFNRAFNIETSRGCPHSCSFCHNIIYRQKYRYVSSEIISQTLFTLKEEYNIDGIVFQEDNLFANIERIKNILIELKNNNLKWKGNSRINYFEKFIDNIDFMHALENSNCSTLQFGLESGSQRVLDIINKKINVDEYISINKKLANYNIKLRYNFIVGFPGESKEDIESTFQIIEKLKADNKNVLHPFLNIYTPYPGTPLFKVACEKGFKTPHNTEGWASLSWNNNIGYQWLSDETNDLINNFTKGVSILNKTYYFRVIYNIFTFSVLWYFYKYFLYL